jgi:uncharacterized membrane protein YjgN (DUF898 family)
MADEPSSTEPESQPPVPATPIPQSPEPVPSGAEKEEEWKPLFSYHGDGGDLFKIFIINYVLSIITLGFYRFWGKTRIRRYVWSNVEIFGDRLEYTGTAKELLIGFLVILLLVLVPVFVLPEFILTLSESQDVTLQSIVGTVQALLIYFLIPVAIYRARRYRLTRTQWRSIRGGQTGKASVYGLSTVILYAMAPLTLFLGLPFFRRVLSEYRIGHTWFGATKLEFAPRTMPVFKAFVLAGLLYILVLLVLGILAAFLTSMLPNASWTDDKVLEDLLHGKFS